MRDEPIKPGYKRTEVGVIPEDWEVKRLGSICDIVMGQSPSSAHYNNKGEGLPLIQGNADISNRKTIKRIFTTEITKQGRRGDILMSVRAPVGEISRTFFDVCLGRGMCAIRYPNDFLYHALVAKESAWVKFSKGSTFDSVNSEDVEAFCIELPSDEKEQVAIAEVLSDVDALLEALDRLIAKKRAIKQGAMQALLTGRMRLPGFSDRWNRTPLGDIAQITMGQSPDSRNYNVEGRGIPLVQGNADIKSRRSIRRVWTTQITKTCDSGDLLLTVRAPVGVVGQASEYSCLGRGVCSLKPNGVNGDFLYHALIFAESQWDIVEQGSTFTSANSSQISAFTVGVPTSLPEQRAIAEVLSDIDAEIDALEKRRAKLRDIKQGMMQELLTGRVRLVGPNAEQ